MPASDCLFLDFVFSGIPVRIIEDLPDGLALGRLCEADHVVGGADLHKGEAGLQRFLLECWMTNYRSFFKEDFLQQ